MQKYLFNFLLVIFTSSIYTSEKLSLQLVSASIDQIIHDHQHLLDDYKQAGNGLPFAYSTTVFKRLDDNWRKLHSLRKGRDPIFTPTIFLFPGLKKSPSRALPCFSDKELPSSLTENFIFYNFVEGLLETEKQQREFTALLASVRKLHEANWRDKTSITNCFKEPAAIEGIIKIFEARQQSFAARKELLEKLTPDDQKLLSSVIWAFNPVCAHAVYYACPYLSDTNSFNFSTSLTSLFEQDNTHFHRLLESIFNIMMIRNQIQSDQAKNLKEAFKNLKVHYNNMIDYKQTLSSSSLLPTNIKAMNALLHCLVPGWPLLISSSRSKKPTKK